MLKRLLATAAGVLALAGAARAGPPPEEKTGIRVGDKAPDFKLKDQDGRERGLSELLKTGPVAVVFHRSARW